MPSFHIWPSLVMRSSWRCRCTRRTAMVVWLHGHWSVAAGSEGPLCARGMLLNVIWWECLYINIYVEVINSHCFPQRRAGLPANTWWSTPSGSWSRSLGSPSTASILKDAQWHVLEGMWWRVSGAQMLASSGIHIQLVQLLGQWSSQAIERYVQESHMTQVPNIPSEVLVGDDLQQGARDLRSSVGQVNQPFLPEVPEVVPAASEAAGPPHDDGDGVGPSQADFDQLQLQVEAIRSTMNKPKEVYVARYRARVLHIGMMEELNNPPHAWRTKCGWCYGLTNFIRLSEVHLGARRCKKCFGLGDQESTDSDSDSSSLSSSSASSDGRWPGMRSSIVFMPTGTRRGAHRTTVCKRLCGLSVESCWNLFNF